MEMIIIPHDNSENLCEHITMYVCLNKDSDVLWDKFIGGKVIFCEYFVNYEISPDVNMLKSFISFIFTLITVSYFPTFANLEE